MSLSSDVSLQMQQSAKVALDQCQLQQVAATKTVLITHLSIVSFNNTDNWNNPLQQWERWKQHLFVSTKTRKYRRICKPNNNTSSDVM